MENVRTRTVEKQSENDEFEFSVTKVRKQYLSVSIYRISKIFNLFMKLFWKYSVLIIKLKCITGGFFTQNITTKLLQSMSNY